MTGHEWYPRTGVVLPDRDGLPADGVVSLAEYAESAGIGSVWCWDGWGYDPFAILGRIAGRTDCPLGTGIANAFARSPAALAMAALALHDSTDGRFVLGLGASTPGLVEGLHGAEFDRPVRRLRELIEILDTAFAGGRLAYEGEVFDLDGPPLVHADGVDIPVFNGALGEANAAMTVAHADGIMLNLVPFDGIEGVLSSARERAGVEADPHVALQIPTWASDDPERARRAVAEYVAGYVGGVEAYNRAVARAGFEDAAGEIRRAWAGDDRERAVSVTERDLVDSVAVVGTPLDVRERLDSLLDGPANMVLATLPDAMTRSGIEATLDAVGGV